MGLQWQAPAHGTAGLGFANSGGQLAVGAGLTVGILFISAQTAFWKGVPLGPAADRIPARPGKIFVQLLLGFL